MTERILITGSSGLIGSHTAELFESDSRYQVKRFQGDITRREDVIRNLRDVDTVIHFAALTYVPPSWDNPWEYSAVNYGGTLNFLENHKMFSKMVYLSTSHALGNQAIFPISNNAEPAPRDPYSISKAAATYAVKDYSEKFGFESLIVRPYNSFGPRQSKNFVIPTMILQTLDKGRIVLKGDTQKELLFVKDDARAIKGLLDNNITGTIQLCKGKSYRISDVARMILEDLKMDPRAVEILPSDRGSWDIQKLEGDPASLYQALPGFQFTDMGMAIHETVEYYKGESR